MLQPRSPKHALSAVEMASVPHFREDDYRSASAQRTVTKARIHSIAKALPSDVLMEVFFWTVQGSELYNSLECTSSPNNVAGVCRLWRDAALSIPSLWSNISLPHLPDAKPIPLGKIGSYLQKSKGSPLNISMYISTCVPFLYELLVLFNENRRRCVTVNIGLPRRCDIPKDFLDLGDMPLLKQFKIGNSYWRNELDLSNSPLLTSLHHYYNQCFKLRMGETPLHNLIEVRLETSFCALRGGLSAVACMALLQAAPQLEVLSMTIYEANGNGSGIMKSSYPVIHLSKLRELRLFHESWGNIGDLRLVLQHLQAPNLTNVDIGILDGDVEGENGDCDIAACLERTQPNESLRNFLTNAMLVSALERCLPFVPSLESLSINFSHEWPELFSLLTLQADLSVQICPKLKVLEFLNYDPDPDWEKEGREEPSKEPLITMVLSRWNPPDGRRCLEVVIIEYSLPIGFVGDPRIARCIEEGLLVGTE